MIKIGIITLGCAKNQVNTEQMIWLLRGAGYSVSGEANGADVVVINTCGFIESAKTEAINHILAISLMKRDGQLGKILVTGCLAQRYADEILTEIPEVDGIVGTGSYGDIVSAVEQVFAGNRPILLGDINAPVDETARVRVSPPGWAYLKIAEGCDNRCSYCVIPSLRGRYRSRPLENILAEARELVSDGVKEIIVVAQDITRYGTDLYGERRLASLLKKLTEIEGLYWIRLHYLYPDEIDDNLINVIAGEDKILPYLDIPIQHINDRILTRMNRRGTGDELRLLFAKLRERIPNLVLRTSIITGLPGEGEMEFEELAAFLRRERIERAGVFPFSPEEGTPAYSMTDRVDGETAAARAEKLMDVQALIMDEFDLGRIGSEIDILTEGYDAGREMYYGRSFAESPDVDGYIFFSGGETEAEAEAEAGEFTRIRITGAADGEVFGEILRRQ